jgi:hypothetical protein
MGRQRATVDPPFPAATCVFSSIASALAVGADPTDTTGTKGGIASAGSANWPSLAALIQFDSCYKARSCRRATFANYFTRCDCLSNNPPLLFIAPPSAADYAGYVRVAPNGLRVIANVDHNLHMILDPKNHDRALLAFTPLRGTVWKMSHRGQRDDKCVGTHFA